MSTPDAAELVEELEADGIQLRLESSELRFRSPQGALTPERLALLREHRRGVISIVRSRSPPADAVPSVPGAEAVWIPTPTQESMARYYPPLLISDPQRWRGPLSFAAAQAAIDALVRRHSLLRTHYTEDVDGRLWAVTERALRVPLELVDLTGLPESQRHSQGRALAVRLMETPFDLMRGPLLRVTAFKLADEEYVLLLVICHSIFDGRSKDVLYDEFAALYVGMLTSAAVALPPLPVEFRTHVQRRNVALDSAEYHSHLLFWRDRLRNARRPVWLPCDRQTPLETGEDLSPTGGVIHGTPLAALRSLARETQSTMFLCTLTALGMLLCRWGDGEDVFFWIVHTGRPSAEHAGLVGCYADLGPFMMGFGGNPTFRQACARAKSAYEESLPHLGVNPLPLQSLLKRARDAGLFTKIACNYNLITRAAREAREQEKYQIPGVSVEHEFSWVHLRGRHDERSKLALTCNFFENDEGLGWAIQHKSGLFEDSTVKKGSNFLATVLARAAENPDILLAELLECATPDADPAGARPS